MILSVVIPSYKDPLLHKTIDSLLDNSELGDQLEVIAVLDGYESKTSFREDSRIKVIRHENNLGMRVAINTGVSNSTGEFIMRTDEHCMFGKGYDRILISNIEDNWIVTPRRYFLDTEKWEVMKLEPIDYMRLAIAPYARGIKFAGVRWHRPDRDNIPIDETIAMQGSCWIMKRSWWDNVIGELQIEGYGTHYQDSHEMSFKTWQAGGHLIVNKNTWYAHKHRLFKRTHMYGGKEADACFEYSLNTWRKYFEEVIDPWQKTLV